jgi:hypothetical protein
MNNETNINDRVVSIDTIGIDKSIHCQATVCKKVPI